jgi:hypothetical protein
MRGIAVALVLLPLSGCAGSCDGRESRSNPHPTASATWAMPPERLSSAVFEGVFPPRWRIGDHWRIRVETQTWDQLGQAVREVTKEYDYRVAATPSEGGDEYRIEAGWRGRPHYVITFRARDGSFSSRSEYRQDKPTPSPSRLDEMSGSLPYLKYGATPPVFAYPVLPPNLVNPFQYLVPDHFDNAGVQTVEATPEGLRFIIREVDRLGKLAQIIEWRRGEAWWSTAQFWTLSDAEEQPENGIFSREPSWTAELVRPEDPEPLPGWPWEPPKH